MRVKTIVKDFHGLTVRPLYIIYTIESLPQMIIQRKIIKKRVSCQIIFAGLVQVKVRDHWS